MLIYFNSPQADSVYEKTIEVYLPIANLFRACLIKAISSDVWFRSRIKGAGSKII